MHCLATYLDTRLLSAAGELGENTTSFTGRHFVKFGDKMRREDKNSLALIQVDAVSKKLSPTTDHFCGQEENAGHDHQDRGQGGEGCGQVSAGHPCPQVSAESSCFNC